MNSPALPAPRLRVVTPNVWGTRGDWPAPRAVLRAELTEPDADQLTLQETIVTAGYDQAADVLSPGYHLVHQGRQGDRRPGCHHGQPVAGWASQRTQSRCHQPDP